MFKDLFKNYIYPIAVFSGGMLGVGFLGLPYIAMKAGIWLMLLYFLVLTTLVVVINMIFCEISLKTPDYKRFPGFVGYYLGGKAKVFQTLSTVLGTFGVLLAYLLIGSQFLKLVLYPIIPCNDLYYLLAYFFVVSLIVYFDIKVIAKVEFSIIILLFLSFVLIFVESFSKIKISNIFVQNQINLSNFFLPYGALLFALWGTGIIPEIEEMLGAQNKKKNLKKIIAVSTIIISIFYLLFILLILGITGNKTDPTALAGLKNFLGDGIVLVALIVGTLATFTAFITQALVLKKSLMFDLKIKHWQAFVITCFPPLILFLLGLKSFIPVISIVGGVLLGISGIFILIMYKKIGGKNIIIYPLALVFLLGVIYEIIYFVK